MNLPWLKRTHVVPSLVAFVTIIATGFAVSNEVAAAAPTAKDIERVGSPFVGSVGITQTTRQLMEGERLHPGTPSKPILVPDQEWEEREEIAHNNPASPRVASIPSRPPDQLTGYRRDKGLGIQIYSPQTI